jgi:hypothetical protein
MFVDINSRQQKENWTQNKSGWSPQTVFSLWATQVVSRCLLAWGARESTKLFEKDWRGSPRRRGSIDPMLFFPDHSTGKSHAQAA